VEEDVEGEDEDGEDAEEENEGVMGWEWENERVKEVEGRKWRSGGDGVVRFLRGCGDGIS